MGEGRNREILVAILIWTRIRNFFTTLSHFGVSTYSEEAQNTRLDQYTYSEWQKA